MKNYIIIELVDNQISDRFETTGESFEDVMSRYGIDYQEAIDNKEIEFVYNTLNWQVEDQRVIIIELN
jgi:NADH:ubiquinone oxidoreductase subunit C